MSVALRMIAVLYGFMAITSLLTVYMHVAPILPLRRLPADEAYFYSVFLGIWILNAAACAALAYAFVRLKRWGRWLAVLFNGTWATLGVVVLLRAAFEPPESAGPILVMVGYVGFFGGLMTVALSKWARDLMRRR
jgi:hypothetical protein